MAEKPSELPRWADQTPANIVNPTELQKDTGWEAGNPRRQYDNWFKNTAYRWLAWIWQSLFWWTDLGPDQALPQGSAPATGAGRVVAAASFSARVIVDGYGVGPISGPARTYAATTDTYWDLGADGVWDANEVPSGNPAPALAASHVRVYRVRTDASNRTAVEDYRRTGVRITSLLELDHVRFGADLSALIARVTAYFLAGSSTDKTLYFSSYPFTGSAGYTLRIYRSHTGASATNAARPLEVTINASWNGTQWVADDAALRSLKLELSLVEIALFVRAAAAASPFADSAAGWNLGTKLFYNISPDTALVVPGVVFATTVSTGSVSASGLVTAATVVAGTVAPTTLGTSSGDPGTIYGNSIVGAKGRVFIGTADVIGITSPLNIDIAACSVSGDVVTIVFDNAFAEAPVVVLTDATLDATKTDVISWKLHGPATTTQFQVRCSDTIPTAVGGSDSETPTLDPLNSGAGGFKFTFIAV